LRVCGGTGGEFGDVLEESLSMGWTRICRRIGFPGSSSFILVLILVFILIVFLIFFSDFSDFSDSLPIFFLFSTFF
jgi:hypothetical protein